MTMMEKLNVLKNAIANTELTFQFAWPGCGAPVDFLARLKEFQWLPPSYAQFMTVTDGATFDNFIIYGSGTTHPRLSVWKLQEVWKKFVCSDEMFGIGTDPNGDLLGILKDYRVARFESHAPFVQHIVASDFDSLVADVFLGEQFLSYFGEVSLDDIAGDKWVTFLRAQGWLHFKGTSRGH